MRRDIRECVEEYFNENNITDLMNYGSSRDEGFSDISDVVADCLVKVGYLVEYNYSEEISDGKYEISVGCLDRGFRYDLYAWDGVDDVVEIIEDILE